ncbi:phosphohydrolase [Salinarchaeum laminariae]|nr:phosphohydrolase [Salinarchaeum laminariae]
MMPDITVSDSLYSQLDQAAEEDLEAALWEMVYLHRRGNDPSE